jgi:hypothetical protein
VCANQESGMRVENGAGKLEVSVTFCIDSLGKSFCQLRELSRTELQKCMYAL